MKADFLSTAALYSDNIYLRHQNREDGVIWVIELGFTATFQLTEGLQFNASAVVGYFPLTNEVGFAGNTPLSGYGFGLTAIPSLFTQLTWDTNIAGWPVVFFDEFSSSIGQRTYGGRDQYGYFNNRSFEGEDVAGRYAFRVGSNSRGDNFRNPNQFNDSERDVGYYSNRVGLLTERFLPGSIHLKAKAVHEDLWYNQGGRGLPTIREQITVSAYWERPNLRFKPFLTYEAFRSSLSTPFNQTVTLGVTGPITDQLSLYASVSYFHGYQDRDDLLWRVTLDHEAGPYTHESLSVGRATSFFEDEIFTFQTYNLQQILGPRFRANLFFTHQTVEDLQGEFSNREFFSAGILLSLQAGPRTELSASYIFSHQVSNPGAYMHTARLQANYRFTDTLTSQFLYQYQHRDSDRGPDSFRENLLFLQITKEFR